MWIPLDSTVAHCITFVDFLFCCIVSFVCCIVSLLLQCVSCLFCIMLLLYYFCFCKQLNYNNQLVVYVSVYLICMYACVPSGKERLQPTVQRLNYKSNHRPLMRQARLTKCTTPRVHFISINVLAFHLYALPQTECHLECIIIAIKSFLSNKKYIRNSIVEFWNSAFCSRPNKQDYNAHLLYIQQELFHQSLVTRWSVLFIKVAMTLGSKVFKSRLGFEF